jgi:hypothetical protein
VFVLVEPLYGSPAVAAALESGWGSVELADATEAAPIPLVSFEQAPPAGQRGKRCRVRTSDLRAAAFAVIDGSGADDVCVGSPAAARPCCAQLALRAEDLAEALAGVTFVAVDGPDGLAADSWWACGMLVRVLLDELHVRESQLTDAAGLAVSIATGAESAATQLAAGARWARHLAAGGAEDDLRVAAAVDSIGIVPRVMREGDSDDALAAPIAHPGS